MFVLIKMNIYFIFTTFDIYFVKFVSSIPILVFNFLRRFLYKSSYKLICVCPEYLYYFMLTDVQGDSRYEVVLSEYQNTRSTYADNMYAKRIPVYFPMG